MPSLGTVLKTEIARLSRKEARREVLAINRASAHHRRRIAELKRQVLQLEQQVGNLTRQFAAQCTPANSTATEGTKLRFVAKGFRAHRAKLGLSAADCARLLGVSAQSVYNWEGQVSVPRRDQLTRIAALRRMGKREARARLDLRANSRRTAA
ncbi:MAG: helix-turn-helix domain-containing protein [Casimicrobiaceae bacterium]